MHAFPGRTAAFCFFALGLAASCRHTQKDSEVQGVFYESLQNTGVWPNGIVPVCVEASAAVFSEEVAAIKQAVEAEYHARTIVKSEGWKTCTPDFRGVHLRHVPGARPVTDVEAGFDSMSVTLNFDFDWDADAKTYCPATSPARRKNCAATVFLHEFGHVLGLGHEHDHHASTCVLEFAPPSGGIYVYGDYDEQSIMNYCLTHKTDYGAAYLKLSVGDIATIDWLYGPAVRLGVPKIPALVPENFTTQDQPRFGFTYLPRSNGFLIKAVFPELAAAEAGLQIGDVVTKIGDVPVRIPPDLRTAIYPLLEKNQEAVSLQIQRGAEQITLNMKLAQDAITPGTVSGN